MKTFGFIQHKVHANYKFLKVREIMTVQSEYQLENELITQLQGLGYATVTIKDWGMQQSPSRMKANYCPTSKPKLNVPMALHHYQKLSGSR